jgi:uncharacterized membrane protein YidH (DUF202 family)
MYKRLLVLFSFFAPVILFAQTSSGTFTVKTLMSRLTTYVLNPLILLLFVLAAALFILGLVEFLAKTSNEEGRQIGKRHMVWGIVGMLIMVSVFGIMNLLITTFGFKRPPEKAGGPDRPIELPGKVQ